MMVILGFLDLGRAYLHLQHAFRRPTRQAARMAIVEPDVPATIKNESNLSRRNAGACSNQTSMSASRQRRHAQEGLLLRTRITTPRPLTRNRLPGHCEDSRLLRAVYTGQSRCSSARSICPRQASSPSNTYVRQELRQHVDNQTRPPRKARRTTGDCGHWASKIRGIAPVNTRPARNLSCNSSRAAARNAACAKLNNQVKRCKRCHEPQRSRGSRSIK